MTDAVLIKLMSRLLQDTRLGKISWEEEEKATFIFSASEASVEVSGVYDRYGKLESVQFKVINGQGLDAASVRSEDEKKGAGKDREGISVNDLLYDLLWAATASANDFYNALRDIYKALGWNGENESAIFE